MATMKQCAFISASVIVFSLICSADAEEPMRFNLGGPQKECASTCHEEDCNQFNIRYGKFCGVGHGGCAGEKPCDGVDRCCKRHDECVEEKGPLNNDCHSAFITCLDRQAGSGEEGFSRKCPYSLIIPTMKSGIQMAMSFASAFQGGNMRDQLDL